MLSAMLPSIRFLSSAVMTAAATTLALMLALVGFGQGTDSKLAGTPYQSFSFQSITQKVSRQVENIPGCQKGDTFEGKAAEFVEQFGNYQ